MSQSTIEGLKEDQVERIDPRTVPAGVMAIHEVRYEFAKGYCRGRRVLDVACGAGYGSAMLAKVAKEVVGGDINHNAVTYARRAYQEETLEFRIIDAQKMDLPSGSFDTVVSFETIEHLLDIEAYLGEVTRVLAPAGILLVSTPKVRRTTRRPENPHHTMEFSAEDFRALLKDYFPSVELHGQVRVQGRIHYWLQKLDMLGIRHYIPNKLRRTIDRTLVTAPFEEMGLTDQKIEKEDLRHAHDLIAVCTR